MLVTSLDVVALVVMGAQLLFLLELVTTPRYKCFAK